MATTTTPTDALLAAIEALRVDPDSDRKPRGAARETWAVGFNDALDEVLALLRAAAKKGK